ncbi:MAG: spore coat U domain-containing protein [Pseudomonadota bacterium]
MNLKKLFVAAGIAAACLSVSAQTTGDINVSASVIATCSISTNPLAFGAYNSLSGTALRVDTSLAITCSQGSNASIALGAGNNLLVAQRRMTDGTAFLNYSIFQPASAAAGAACAYTTSWGNGTVAGNALVTAAAPNLSARTYNVCGEIPPGQSAPVATYNDVVVATVTF